MDSLLILCGYALWLLPWTWIHEGGHYLAALLLAEEKISFSLCFGSLGKLRVPRWIWALPPGLPRYKRLAICYAGFLGEFAAGGLIFSFSLLWGWIYFVGALAHLGLYPHYSGDLNDFTYPNME